MVYFTVKLPPVGKVPSLASNVNVPEPPEQTLPPVLENPLLTLFGKGFTVIVTDCPVMVVLLLLTSVKLVSV